MREEFRLIVSVTQFMVFAHLVSSSLRQFGSEE